MLKIGDQAPDFTAPDQNGATHQLANYKGRWVLLYFYPKDNTLGCTIEACALRDNYDGFKKIGAVVLGVSTDSVDSHINFSDKYGLPFAILADVDKKIVTAYGAAGFAKRISFLIDPAGRIAKLYDYVKPAEHAAEVLKDLTALKKEA